MPSGAALLLAGMVIMASGLADGLVGTLGVRRRILLAWSAAAVGASAINLGLPPRDPAVLWNPGGTMLPAAFAAWVLVSGRLGWRRALLGSAAGGFALTAITGWAEMAGVGWPATAAAGVAAAALSAVVARSVPGAVASAAGAAAFAAVLRGALGWIGAVPWPATLGGGTAFDAAVLAVMAAPLLARLPAVWRWARPAAPVAPTAR